MSDGNGGYSLKRVMPGEGRKARLEQMAADLREQITYWREHVKAAEASGVKVWTKADFTKGDYALSRGTWYEVLQRQHQEPHGSMDESTAGYPQ